MNKYTAIGLLATAAEGKRIIVLSATAQEVRAAQDEVARVVNVLTPVLNVGDTVRITWTNGDQRITLPNGGAIVFMVPTSVHRHTADVVLVEHGVDLLGDDRIRTDLHRAVLASPVGEIVRY